MIYAFIIGHNIDWDAIPSDAYKIGIDHGAFLALEHGIPLDEAVGDWDSCTAKEREKILTSVLRVTTLNPHKDDTDTMHAYREYCQEKDAKFLLLGSIQGKRVEHFYANLELVALDPRVEMIDQNTRIFQVDHDITLPKEENTFVSFFALGQGAILSLKGFAYDLDHYHLVPAGPISAISNEFVSPYGEVHLHEGKLLCFLSKSDAVNVSHAIISQHR